MRCGKLLLTAMLLLMLRISAADTVLKTGSRLPQLPSPLFLDGSNRTLDEFLGKKFVVLFLWERSPATLNEFSHLVNLRNNLKERAEFVGVGIGDHNMLKNFPGAIRLGFPVNSDKGTIKSLLCRPGDPMPLTVLLDKNGTILWRGKLRQLPAMLKMCEEGKFDLKEQIRNEVFADTVNDAIRKNELDKALVLLRKEYQDHPEKFELLRVQFSILKKLNRRKDALQLLHEAQVKHPNDYRLFEMEYVYLGETGDDAGLKDFFTRLKKQFAKRPEVIIAFAVAESKLSPEKIDPATVIDLAGAGWKDELFVKPGAKASYALEYAMILHIFGRNDLALQLAEIACEDAAKLPKLLEKARTARTYYRKINDISAGIKVPDLKK